MSVRFELLEVDRGCESSILKDASFDSSRVAQRWRDSVRCWWTTLFPESPEFRKPRIPEALFPETHLATTCDEFDT